MKKIGLIVLALVVALGALGVGYAAWSDTLNITATATVGEFDVDFIDYEVTQHSTLGGASANIIHDDAASFSVANAYPGYWATVKYTIKNNGTVPASVSFAKTSTNEIPGVPRFTTPATIPVLDGEEEKIVEVTFSIPENYSFENVEYYVTYTITANQNTPGSTPTGNLD